MSTPERKQYLADKIHNSKLHIKGYDPNCPKCVVNGGIKALIVHLQKCEMQNDKDAYVYKSDAYEAVTTEQRRIIGLLKRLL